jgi:hypothetical protein
VFGANNVIFERKVSTEWTPVQFKDLHIGDTTRMRVSGGDILRGEDGVEEYEVVSTGGSDPDSHRRADILLMPVSSY